MDELKKQLKNSIAKWGKRALKFILLPIMIIIIFLLVLIPSFVYFITVDDGTYKEDDWSSPGFGSAVYESEASINSDGTITAGKTAEDIWNELVANGSRVEEYLSGPESLAKLMNAELITKFPDMRANPDDEIDWKSVDLTKNQLQGIIKLKRSDDQGNVSTLKYTDIDTFYNWIEQYNENGDETAKQNALSHFIIKQNTTSSSDYSTSDMTTDITDAIVKAAKETPSPGAGLCQSWVRQVYANAGLGNNYIATAYLAFKQNCVDTSKDNIPVGAAVYGTGTGSAGHVGIYIGNGQVMDNVGEIKTSSLEDWIKWQEEKGNVLDGKCGWLGWGWQAGAPTTISGGEESNTEEDEKEYGKIETTVKSYSIEVATWSQITTTITTDDPALKDKENESNTTYNMTTTTVNYQELVDKFTMPFNFLWALLVVGEEEDFVLEVADLVYNSDIEITIHDNYTKNTDEDKWTFKKENKNLVSGTVSVPQAGVSQNIPEFTDYVSEHDTYTYTKTIVTETNTLEIGLTKADVWIVKYEREYKKGETQVTTTTEEKEEPDQADYPTEITYEYDTDDYDHEKIDQVVTQVINSAHDRGQSYSAVKRIHVKEYSKYKDIKDTITNTVESMQYTSEPCKIQEKIDKKAEEPNFITIFNKKEYKKNKSNIKNVASWLFEILETNEDTADMVDLVKYLLYIATDKKVNFGVTEFDFGIFDPGNFLSSTLAPGDLIVKTDEPNAAPTVPKETLRAGLSKWASGQMLSNSLLILDKVIEIEEQYHINAVFIYGLLRDESGVGTADTSWVRENNWTSLTSLGHIQYASPQENLEKFVTSTIWGSYYFRVGRYSVQQIGEVYCADPPPPAWANNVLGFMRDLYAACGVEVTDEAIGNTQVIDIARSKLGSRYVYGSKGPDTFDCSGFVYWCFKQVGISVPSSSDGYKKYKGTSKEVGFNQMQPGDILVRFASGNRTGHVAIYIGNGQDIEAMNEERGVTTANIKNSNGDRYTHVFRFE